MVINFLLRSEMKNIIKIIDFIIQGQFPICLENIEKDNLAEEFTFLLKRMSTNFKIISNYHIEFEIKYWLFTIFN